MWLLARRSLEVRPGRTALFLTGFALAVGVMIALLSVGEAIVEQARDKDLVGGGDVILVPAGADVEVLELGGVTALYTTIPNARFLYRQLLRGPRFASDVAAAAPSWSGRPVFLRAGDATVQGIASATVPSLERAVGTPTPVGGWEDSPGERAFASLAGPDIFHEIDRWHLPDPGHPGADRWAEWYYFNLLDPATGRFAYLSFFVAGDVRRGRATGTLAVQLGQPGQATRRYTFTAPVDSTAWQRGRAGIDLGRARVILDGTAYVLEAGFHDDVGGVPVRLRARIEPRPRAYYPPIVVRGADGFESGYVVPLVLGRANGTIAAGGERFDFDGGLAYHDHNWGYWKDVRWDWGQAQSRNADLGLFYGAIHAPELTAAGQGQRYFLTLTSEEGFLGLFRPGRIEYGGWRPGPPIAGRATRVPSWIRIRAERAGDSLAVTIRVTGVTASLPAGDPRDPGSDSPRLGAGHAFLQMRGEYAVRGRVAGRTIDFDAPGAAETFVPLESRGRERISAEASPSSPLRSRRSDPRR